MNLFEHIFTAWDKDPYANIFVRCKFCGCWENAAYGNSVCSACGCEYEGDEETQAGKYPPGW